MVLYATEYGEIAMTLRELLGVVGATYNDVDLGSYMVIAVTSKEKEQYVVRGVWLDHDKRNIRLSLTPPGKKRAKKD